MDSKSNNLNSVPASTVSNAAQTAQPITSGSPTKAKKPRRKFSELPKKTKAAIIASVAVIVAGLGTGAFFLLHRPTEIAQEAQEAQATPATPVSKLRLQGNGLSDFDLAFLQLENQPENKIYSPLSIKYALAMLADGAAGNSQTQITNLIGDYHPKSYLNSANRSLANALFVRSNFREQVLPTYSETISNKYNASLLYDDFTSAAAINSWVSDKTLGIINQLLEDESVQNLDFTLVNALAIDMNWVNQLQCNYTGESGVPCKPYKVHYAHEQYTDYVSEILGEDLYDAMDFDGQANIKAVNLGASFNNYDIIKELGEDHIRSVVRPEYEKWLVDNADLVASDPDYFETNVDKYLDQYIKELSENYGRSDSSSDYYLSDTQYEKVFAKDLQEYDGSTLQYVAVMPKAGTLADYIADLDADTVNSLIDGLKSLENKSFKDGVVTKITGHLPLFQYGYQLKLKENLQALGITDIFEQGTADLSNLVQSDTAKEEHISMVAHKADIDFSNDGIRAAAATAGGGSGAAGPGFDHLWEVPVETIDITFDRPFLYLIRDKSTGEVWFTGAVYQPTAK